MKDTEVWELGTLCSGLFGAHTKIIEPVISSDQKRSVVLLGLFHAV